VAYKTLIIDARKCTGCRSCESYCALKHEAVCNPAKGRVHVVKWEQEGIFVPINCMRCEQPACEMACPRQATFRNYETGAMQVDAARCIGCFSCVAACPFGATFADAENGKVLKCDLCDGDPTCAKVCPTEAIRCVEMSTETYAKLVANAKCIPELVQQALGEPNVT
jgi:Fe-S-cluster-containing hydrogenase component 2